MQTDEPLQVQYTMNVDFNIENHQYKGLQSLKIINHTDDTLKELYYHLYFNAFQPGSDMDIRSQNILDPDTRIGNRIAQLKEDEIGFIKPQKISQSGKRLKFEIEGTIMKVFLRMPLMPGDSIIVNIKYLAQVPLQIRRSGRFNKEGVDYSMAQWYPKLCNFDYQGWHTDPYIGREFYAPWGDFEVSIRIDKRYIVAATGYLQAEDALLKKKKSSNSKVWKFYAPMVHDFVWAADPDYVHEVYPLKDNRTLQFYHLPNPRFDSAWMQLPAIMEKSLEFIENNFGPYPYKTYSFIQGGDGGMEYPMATLITGNRPLISLVGVALHEWMHSWYQMMLATNEALYPWMDEGFTSYAEDQTMNYVKSQGLIPGVKPSNDVMQSTKQSFIKFLKIGEEEPLSTHSDHYNTNQAYGMASYVKGALCLMELKYICGEEAFRRGLLDYYWKWRFHHPTPDDFFRVFEKASNLELDWFKEYWVYTTKTIDYAIDTVYESKGKTIINLKKVGLMPMPVDILVKSEKKDFNYTIPLDLMRGSKKNFNGVILKPWHWVNPKYQIELDIALKNIKLIALDPDKQLVDVDETNNNYRP